MTNTEAADKYANDLVNGIPFQDTDPIPQIKRIIAGSWLAGWEAKEAQENLEIEKLKEMLKGSRDYHAETMEALKLAEKEIETISNSKRPYR